MKQNSCTCTQITIFWLQRQTCHCKLLHQGIKVLEPFTWSPVFALQSAALSSFWCTYQLPGLSLITSMYLSPRNNMDVQYNLDCWYLKIPDWSVNKAHRGANVHLNKRSLSGEHKLIIHRSVAEPLSCTSATARRGFLSRPVRPRKIMLPLIVSGGKKWPQCDLWWEKKKNASELQIHPAGL